ncbi:MAG: enoyl-CoA hydratase/isomerase family protein [SAR324 cluster bacterium]|nr:enoyl-CoA hydratase/isomerase family protein [SAR324 cluster bacterium]
MELENIKIDTKDNIATVTIDHPPVNAWNLATILDFETAIDALENDNNVRVVILTGAGEKCFSAGYDLSDAANRQVTGPKAKNLWHRIDRFPKPVIAAINGFALGGGLELAMCCHFRIMADAPKVMLGLTELNLGIIPGWGGTQRLPLIVGKAKALDMILFGKKINAVEALEIGLVNQVSSPADFMADVMAFAQKLAHRPPIAVSWVLKAVSSATYEGIEAGLKVETEGSSIVRESKDGKEGFAAFLEKREPRFTGE